MTRNQTSDWIAKPRALIARLAVLVLVLQAIIPGVLAHSGADDDVWCRTLAAETDPDGTSPVSGTDSCIVCTVMSAGNAPLSAATPALVAPVAAEMALYFEQARPAALALVAFSPPIRAPPPPRHSPAMGAAAEGCALT